MWTAVDGTHQLPNVLVTLVFQTCPSDALRLHLYCCWAYSCSQFYNQPCWLTKVGGVFLLYSCGRYKGCGQPVLIGGSMGTSSYVLVGTQGAMEQTFGSTCHGAGRAMSRAQSKKTLGYKEVSCRHFHTHCCSLLPVHTCI